MLPISRKSTAVWAATPSAAFANSGATWKNKNSEDDNVEKRRRLVRALRRGARYVLLGVVLVAAIVVLLAPKTVSPINQSGIFVQDKVELPMFRTAKESVLSGIPSSDLPDITCDFLTLEPVKGDQRKVRLLRNQRKASGYLQEEQYDYFQICIRSESAKPGDIVYFNITVESTSGDADLYISFRDRWPSISENDIIGLGGRTERVTFETDIDLVQHALAVSRNEIGNDLLVPEVIFIAVYGREKNTAYNLYLESKLKPPSKALRAG